MLFFVSEEEQGLQAAGEALYWLSAAVVRSVTHPRRISLTSVSTLAALGRLGPQRITELAALQGVAQPSMTAVIGALEQSGYVARTPDPTDRRASLISLTAAGEEFLAERRRAGAERVAALARRLSPQEAAALAAAVPALVHLRALQEEPAPAAGDGQYRARRAPKQEPAPEPEPPGVDAAADEAAAPAAG
jgi:DNA-binding MarR family transcriptional regulator